MQAENSFSEFAALTSQLCKHCSHLPLPNQKAHFWTVFEYFKIFALNNQAGMGVNIFVLIELLGKSDFLPFKRTNRYTKDVWHLSDI